MTREALLLAQALLDHHKICRSRNVENSGIDSYLIAYDTLCDAAGISHLKPTVGKLLREIARWCHENGWPPLNALAVNHQTRMPGHGYGGAPGCSLDHWPEEAMACINFRGYPDTV